MTLVMPTVTDITSSTNGLVASFFSNSHFFLVFAVIVSYIIHIEKDLMWCST